MKNVSTVSITHAIIHLVDPSKEEPVLSDRPLLLAPDSEIRAYFEDHIRNSLHDTAARTASFKDDSQLKGLSDTILGYPSKFVETSKKIAQHLFDSSDKRISNGAVAICLYTSPEFAEVKRFIAILKLDHSDGFSPVPKKEKDGIFVDFKKIKDVVPSKREKLLKCAFIRPRSDADLATYDMVVLDRQTSSTNEPALFFVEKFLGAEYFATSTDLTRKFYVNSVNTVNLLRDTIGEEKSEYVRKAIDVAMRGESIDTELWVSNLSIAKVAKETLKKALDDQLHDSSFEVDEAVAAKLVKKRVFKAPGLRMTIDADAYDSIVFSTTKENGYIQLVLRVPELVEIAK